MIHGLHQDEAAAAHGKTDQYLNRTLSDGILRGRPDKSACALCDRKRTGRTHEFSGFGSFVRYFAILLCPIWFCSFLRQNPPPTQSDFDSLFFESIAIIS
jgi:hypothetical protein